MLLELLHTVHFINNMLKKRLKEKKYKELKSKINMFCNNLILYWYKLFIKNWNKQKPQIGSGERIIYLYYDEGIKHCLQLSNLNINFLENTLSKRSYRNNYKEYVKILIMPGYVKFTYHFGQIHYDIYNKTELIGYNICFKKYFCFKRFQDENEDEKCYLMLIKKFLYYY